MTSSPDMTPPKPPEDRLIDGGWKYKLISEFSEILKTRERYAETIIARLHQPSYVEAKKWDFKGGNNLLLCGPTGAGKTRIALILIKHLMTSEWTRCEVITETEFALEVGDRAMSGKVREYLTPLCRCPVLFLDDIGKAPPTERFVSSLYHLAESRHAGKKPTILTTQLTSEELTAKLSSRDESSSHALAILRRFSEDATVIKMAPNTGTP